MNEQKILQLPDLMQATEKILVKIGYKPECIKKHKCIWNKFKQFTEQKNVYQFSMELAGIFLQEQYDYFFGAVASKKVKEVIVALRFLSDYQIHGVIKRHLKKRKCLIWPSQFSTIFEEYFKSFEKQELSPNTIYLHKFKLYTFSSYLDDIGIEDFSKVTPECIHKFIATLVSCQKATLALYLQIIKRFLKYVYISGYHPIDLSESCPRIKKGNGNRIPSAYSSDEIQRMLDCVDRGNPRGKRDYAILLIVAKLGLRAGDVRNLKFDNIKWDTNKIELIQSKTQKPLSLPLLEDIGWALIDYIKCRPQVEFQNIFVRHYAPFDYFSSDTSFHNITTKYMRMAKIPIPKGKKHGLHSLRHSLASTLLEKNTPLPVISEILGHTDSNSTQIYLKIDVTQLSQCALEVPYEAN